MTRATADALERARLEAQKQWNANPCGAVETSAHDAAFFARVEAERYRQQYWQRDFFDYRSFGGKSVLEIGIGLGTDIKQFARSGATVAGADITDRHLELTQLNFDLEGLPIDLVKADAVKLPFDDDTFDCVHSFGVLHHIPDIGAVLKEIRRVLKPGGVLQTAVYHKYSIHTATLFLRAALRGSLLSKGVGGTLATIEAGADGSEIAPYVKLYGKSEWERTLADAGFFTRRGAVRQVQFEGMKALNRLRPLEGLIGWYVANIAEKPLVPSPARPR
jgi:SAM-dependent methyltransferase